MDDIYCVDHPEEEVWFVCVPCGRLICRDCKMAEHEGHETKDIQKAAEQAKKDIGVFSSQLQTAVHIIQSQLRDAEANMKLFEESVRDAKLELRGRVEAIVKWAHRYREETAVHLKTVAEEGRRAQEEMVRSLAHKMRKLEQFKQKANEGLASESIFKAIDTDISLKEQGPGENLSCSALLRNAQKHRLLVALTGNAEFSKYECEVKGFFGKPVLSQIGKESTNMAILNEFSCSKDPGVSVSSIQPLDDGMLCVVCSDDNNDEHYVAVYDVEKKTCLLKEPVSSEFKRAKMIHTPNSNLSLYPAMSTGVTAPKVLQLDNIKPTGSEYEYETKGNSNLFVLKRPKKAGGGGYKVCDELAPPDQSWRAPFKINVDDPVTLRADSYGQFGQYFAVIQDQREARQMTRGVSTIGTLSPKALKPSVALYRRQNPDRFALFQPNVRNFSPSDICFHVVGGKEVLLVADEANSVIYVVNFSAEYVQDGRVDKIGDLGAGCPWLTAPTAMAVDSSGVLWIGCRGGQILSCVPSENLQLWHRPEITQDEVVYNVLDTDENSESASSDQSASGGTVPPVGEISRRIVSCLLDLEPHHAQPGWGDNPIPERKGSISSTDEAVVEKAQVLQEELKQSVCMRKMSFQTPRPPKIQENGRRNSTGYVPMEMPFTGLQAVKESEGAAEKCNRPDALPLKGNVSGDSAVRQQGGQSPRNSQVYANAVRSNDGSQNTFTVADSSEPPTPDFPPPPPIAFQPPGPQPGETPPSGQDSAEPEVPPPLPPRTNKTHKQIPSAKPDPPPYLNFQSKELKGDGAPPSEASRPPPEQQRPPPLQQRVPPPLQKRVPPPEQQRVPPPLQQRSPPEQQRPPPQQQRPPPQQQKLPSLQHEAHGPVHSPASPLMSPPQFGTTDELQKKLQARLKRIDSKDDPSAAQDGAPSPAQKPSTPPLKPKPGAKPTPPPKR